MADNDDQKAPIDLKNEELLCRLGQKWWAEARQQSEQDAREMDAWRLEQVKWSTWVNPYPGHCGSTKWIPYYDSFRGCYRSMSYDFDRQCWKIDGDDGNDPS